MRALIADNDRSITDVLTQTFEGWGLEVTLVADGCDAWHALELDPSISLAVLDRDTAGVNGLDLLSRIRQNERHADLYVILLTARGNRADLAACLDAGADDFLAKPLDPLELRARANTALRVVTFQERLMERVLSKAAVPGAGKSSDALLSVCSYCKSVRSGDQWQEFERFLMAYENTKLSHGVCPACCEAVLAGLKHR